MKLVVSTFQDPALNLALEEMLFNSFEEEFALFYVNTPSVIIGKNQVLQNEVNLEYCAENQIAVYRRISGGGAVYHDLGNMSYSFITFKNKKFDDMSSAFLQPIIYALERFDVKTFIGTRKDLWLDEGYKISGTAAHITAQKNLHHGTILYRSDIEKLKQSLQSQNKDINLKGIPSVVSPVKNIYEYLLENELEVLSIDDFFTQIIRFSREFLKISEEFIISEVFHQQIESLADSKYRLDSWNRRK